MGLFDDLFDGKKSKFEEAGDKILNQVVKTASDVFEKPVMDKALNTINEAAERITSGLEAIKNGEEPSEEAPAGSTHKGLPDFDTLSKKWNSLFDEIEDNQLSKYKICPSCKEAMPADSVFCTNCGTKLPEKTMERRTCPYCGAENRYLALKCVTCGKDLPLITAESDKQE